LWDERYESYSIIDNGKMLSNVCIYKTEMIVDGKVIRANRFGAVATCKSVRGRGLSRFLIEHVLSLYPNTLAYLTANPSVIDFYSRFGFKQIQTYSPKIGAKINNSPDKTIKYKLDDKVFINALYGRGGYSEIVDCLNTQPIQIFNLFMGYADDIYFLPNLDVIVVAKQEENELFLVDTIAKKPISFDVLKKELPFRGVDTVRFGFSPDWLDINPIWTPLSMEDELFFVKGDWGLPKHHCFPVTSET